MQAPGAGTSGRLRPETGSDRHADRCVGGESRAGPSEARRKQSLRIRAGKMADWRGKSTRCQRSSTPGRWTISGWTRHSGTNVSPFSRKSGIPLKFTAVDVPSTVPGACDLVPVSCGAGELAGDWRPFRGARSKRGDRRGAETRSCWWLRIRAAASKSKRRRPSSALALITMEALGSAARRQLSGTVRAHAGNTGRGSHSVALRVTESAWPTRDPGRGRGKTRGTSGLSPVFVSTRFVPGFRAGDAGVWQAPRQPRLWLSPGRRKTCCLLRRRANSDPCPQRRGSKHAHVRADSGSVATRPLASQI